MSEAHEKTRIRQLEDAAAHWEHKYANARQYNRNLEERIRALEAALRPVANHMVIDKANEFIGGCYAIDVVQTAIGLVGSVLQPRSASETTVNQAETAPSDAILNAPTPRGSLPNSLGDDDVSRLCAICDQIIELHPSSHKWTAKETPAKAHVESDFKSPATFTGWIQEPCENCGKLSTEHPQPMMECPTAVNREVVK